MKSQVRAKLTSQQSHFLEVEQSCCLCGSELTFQHQLDDLAIKIREKGQCPSCLVTLKEKEHTIH